MSKILTLPGLKAAIEDKRILRFGVPPEYYQRYLMAEQFIIDERNVTEDELLDVQDTYFSLQEYGLANPPYEYFVTHIIRTLPKKIADLEGSNVLEMYPEIAKSFLGKVIIDSVFWFFKNDKLHFSVLASTEKMAQSIYEFYTSSKCSSDAENDRALIIAIKNKLIVYLSTKGIIKEHKEAKKSQAPINGRPHKKGSGGYTIIRPPESNEIKDGSGGSVSKRPHFRMGHIRKLHPEDKEKWVWVSSCFVNGEPDVQRKAYIVA